MSRAERDMGADAGGVRLRPSYNGSGYMPHDGGDSPAYIAYPAAQAAAMERVVRAARVLEFRYGDDDWSDDAWERAVEELRQALSTLPRAPRAPGGEGG